MSFTSLSIVRKHLLTSDGNALTVENLPITLSGEDELMLPHDCLVADSETVKWDMSSQPMHDGPIILADYDKEQLSSGHIVRGSVVVTLAETLDTVYVEEADYRLDYLSGNIRRVTSGGIPDNQPVHAYYNCYSLFSGISDYALNFERGTIRRRTGSAIPDGATVLIDYVVQAGSVTDNLISQAIIEAEDLIVRSLSTDYTAQSTDQGLATGATLLVLSFVARDMTTEALSRRLTSDAGGRAKEWQNLSNLYETRAWQTLRPFVERYPIHSPEKHSNA